jgi:sulfatase modifying factor 1
MGGGGELVYERRVVVARAPGTHRASRVSIMNMNAIWSRVLSVAAVVFLVASAAQATPISATVLGFYDLVKVGNAKNVADTTGYGAVDHEFWIGKFEFTNAQYVRFLNAIDPAGSSPNGVYNTLMSSDDRGGITRDLDKLPGLRYDVKTNMGNKPVNYVSWFDTARVANWMHNGALKYDTTDATANAPQNNGAYTLGTATTGSSVVRNEGARFYIPTENEWYKAAYYNPTLNSGTGGYLLYGNGFGSGIAPVTADPSGNGTAGTGIMGSGTGNFANYNNGAVWNDLTGNVTTVGTNGAPSYYGAFDMSGNLREWNDFDGDPGLNRGIRGGAYSSSAAASSSAQRTQGATSRKASIEGFRLVSSVPEPATLGMTSVGGLCACGWWILKRRRRART